MSREGSNSLNYPDSNASNRQALFGLGWAASVRRIQASQRKLWTTSWFSDFTAVIKTAAHCAHGVKHLSWGRLLARVSSVPALSMLMLFGASLSASEVTSLQVPAVKSDMVSQVLLNDSVHLSDRVIAVGLYGNIIYSKDGITWKQANSPTRMLLNTISFANDQEGWAAGHDGLILYTSDGGENWEIQHEDPIPGGDIPMPLMDITFLDARQGYAVGAYGMLLRTSNGGQTWERLNTDDLYDLLDSMEREPEPHFNAIIPFQGKLLIAGEVGTILIFDPDALTEKERWTVLNSPYEGSFFGVRYFESGELFVYGLRGNLYRSTDLGQSWDKIETSVITNIFDCTEINGGDLVFVGGSGTLLKMGKRDKRTERLPYRHFDTLVSIERIRDGELLLFGSSGVRNISLK